MNYKDWSITKIKDNIWKAYKDGHQINVSSPRLLRALIDENEGKTQYVKQHINEYKPETLDA